MPAYNPFIGQIAMFGSNFAPRGWALCDGQLLAISQNTALFSILGTTYGGDGRTTFGLPDLRGRAPMHAGSGPGLTPSNLGNRSGTETTTLTADQLPSHTHASVLNSYDDSATSSTVAGNGFSSSSDLVYSSENPDVSTDAASVTINNMGGNQAFNNMQPFQAINFIIALSGVYPSRS